MSSMDPTSRSNFLTSTGYIAAWNSSTSLCATTQSEVNGSISIRMRAQTNLDKIVLVPPVGGYGVDPLLFFEQLVEVTL